MKNTQRNAENGHYIVRYPFNENISKLGESYSYALKRLLSQERALAKNPEHRKQYNEFMEVYEKLGHMSEDANCNIYDGNFLPHHSILKQSSLTTKLRVVFDASAKTSTGKSLNETLMIGPNIQEDLFSLLVRFWSHVFAFTADIEKMYLQIEVHEKDRKFQRILWRTDVNLPIKIFTLNTITYGTSAASFFATRSLKQLSQDVLEIYPKASTILSEDFYIDDVLSGADTINEAKNMIDELTQASNGLLIYPIL